LTVLGWLFVAWVVVSPYRRLPNGGDLELAWTVGQHVLASVTAVLGIALLAAAGLVGRRLGTAQAAVRAAPSSDVRRARDERAEARRRDGRSG
jgi:alpha-1,2-mannosyltransferase